MTHKLFFNSLSHKRSLTPVKFGMILGVPESPKYRRAIFHRFLHPSHSIVGVLYTGNFRTGYLFAEGYMTLKALTDFLAMFGPKQLKQYCARRYSY
jgi:hypothetical protein